MFSGCVFGCWVGRVGNCVCVGCLVGVVCCVLLGSLVWCRVFVGCLVLVVGWLGWSWLVCCSGLLCLLVVGRDWLFGCWVVGVGLVVDSVFGICWVMVVVGCGWSWRVWKVVVFWWFGFCCFVVIGVFFLGCVMRCGYVGGMCCFWELGVGCGWSGWIGVFLVCFLGVLVLCWLLLGKFLIGVWWWIMSCCCWCGWIFGGCCNVVFLRFFWKSFFW